MGKAERNRARSARDRIAAQQAAARKAEQRRRLLIVGGSVGLVVVIIVGFIVFYSLRSPAKTLGKGNLPASVHSAVTSVPASTLATVGTGALLPPSQLPLKTITDKPLTTGGKPDMLYIGAEFCPYCAAMRWSMAVALSRFGTFGPFTGIHSSATDTDPNTPTLTFLNQKYTSKYLTFSPIENETITHAPLQNPTKAQQALWVKYDSSSSGLGYPFIDFGGKAIITGPLYDPAVLKGMSWAQVAASLKDPSNTVSKNVNGGANYVTAAICKMTNNTPSTVCSAAPIPAIEAKL
jgi:thiol-disulfide isomerase/thioredoxin